MNFIVDDIGTVVNAVRDSNIRTAETDIPDDLDVIGNAAPYYLYGHRLQVANDLSQKRINKYPLIALRMPFNEQYVDGILKVKLNIGIFMYTNKNYNSMQRYTNVFKEMLYPIYEIFLEELRTSGLFFWPGKNQERPPHIKVDRLFWGTPTDNGSEKNIFKDPLDAIEIIDLELQQKIKC